MVEPRRSLLDQSGSAGRELQEQPQQHNNNTDRNSVDAGAQTTPFKTDSKLHSKQKLLSMQMVPSLCFCYSNNDQ